MVKPVTVIGEALPVPINPPGLEVTVYPVMAEPPVSGAVNDTVACLLPAVTKTVVGTPGTVAGVIEVEGFEAFPCPTAFLAFTVNVYGVPLVKPETVADVAGKFTVAVRLSGLLVTV